MKRRSIVSGLAALLAVSGSAITVAKAAGTIVKVELVDAEVDPSLKGETTMATRINKSTVKAGAVTFIVHNGSKSLMHEMVLIYMPDPTAELPMDMKENKVIEDKVKHLGEVADLEPGKSGTLKLTLAPGA